MENCLYWSIESSYCMFLQPMNAIYLETLGEKTDSDVWNDYLAMRKYRTVIDKY